MADFFDRPTPGESLTVEPKSRPYERPAEMSKLSQVIDFYISRITQDEVIDNTIDMLDMGVPVELIVDSMTTFFVMQGRHSMDNKMLISPVLHEYIRMLGKQAGVQVVDGLNPDGDKIESSASLADRLRQEIENIQDTEEDDEGVDLMRQTASLLEEDTESKEEDTEIPVEFESMEDTEESIDTEEIIKMEEPMQMGIMARR